MARTNNLNNFLTDVAEAIRSKTGETGEILASEFDSKINNIQTGGGDIGEYLGNVVYPAASSEYPAWIQIVKKVPFVITFDGSNAIGLFARYPNISLPQVNAAQRVNNISYMFSYSRLTNIDLDDLGENFNTENVNSIANLCYYCSDLATLKLGNRFNNGNLTNIEYMCYRCSNLTTIVFGENFNTENVSSMSNAFSYCSKLTTIPKLTANKTISVYNMVDRDTELENLGGLENLGQAYLTTQSANYSNYRLNLSYCNKLTHDSLMNVINNLYDIATKGCKAQSLQLGATNTAKLTEAEIAIATSKGWTVS